MATATASQSLSASAFSKTLVEIPLTTLFQPPTSCFNPAITISPGQIWDEWGTDPTSTLWTDIFVVQSTCFPPSFVLDTDENNPIYSPGLCPQGFTTAVQSERVHDGTHTVTTATCCPSIAQVGTLGALCQWPAPTAVMINQASRISSEFDKYIVLVPAVTVAWQVSDVSKYPALARAVASKNPTSSISAATTDDSGNRTSPHTAAISTRNYTLSTRAKASIGVGVVVGLLVIIGLVIWAMFERRKRKHESALPKIAGYDSVAITSDQKAKCESDRNGT